MEGQGSRSQSGGESDADGCGGHHHAVVPPQGAEQAQGQEEEEEVQEEEDAGVVREEEVNVKVVGHDVTLSSSSSSSLGNSQTPQLLVEEEEDKDDEDGTSINHRDEERAAGTASMQGVRTARVLRMMMVVWGMAQPHAASAVVRMLPFCIWVLFALLNLARSISLMHAVVVADSAHNSQSEVLAKFFGIHAPFVVAYLGHLSLLPLGLFRIFRYRHHLKHAPPRQYEHGGDETVCKHRRAPGWLRVLHGLPAQGPLDAHAQQHEEACVASGTLWIAVMVTLPRLKSRCFVEVRRYTTVYVIVAVLLVCGSTVNVFVASRSTPYVPDDVEFYMRFLVAVVLGQFVISAYGMIFIGLLCVRLVVMATEAATMPVEPRCRSHRHLHGMLSTYNLIRPQMNTLFRFQFLMTMFTYTALLMMIISYASQSFAPTTVLQAQLIVTSALCGAAMSSYGLWLMLRQLAHWIWDANPSGTYFQALHAAQLHRQSSSIMAAKMDMDMEKEMVEMDGGGAETPTPQEQQRQEVAAAGGEDSNKADTAAPAAPAAASAASSSSSSLSAPVGDEMTLQSFHDKSQQRFRVSSSVWTATRLVCMALMSSVLSSAMVMPVLLYTTPDALQLYPSVRRYTWGRIFVLSTQWISMVCPVVAAIIDMGWARTRRNMRVSVAIGMVAFATGVGVIAFDIFVLRDVYHVGEAPSAIPEYALLVVVAASMTTWIIRSCPDRYGGMALIICLSFVLLAIVFGLFIYLLMPLFLVGSQAAKIGIRILSEQGVDIVGRGLCAFLTRNPKMQPKPRPAMKGKGGGGEETVETMQEEMEQEKEKEKETEQIFTPTSGAWNKSTTDDAATTTAAAAGTTIEDPESSYDMFCSFLSGAKDDRSCMFVMPIFFWSSFVGRVLVNGFNSFGVSAMLSVSLASADVCKLALKGFVSAGARGFLQSIRDKVRGGNNKSEKEKKNHKDTDTDSVGLREQAMYTSPLPSSSSSSSWMGTVLAYVPRITRFGVQPVWADIAMMQSAGELSGLFFSTTAIIVYHMQHVSDPGPIVAGALASFAVQLFSEVIVLMFKIIVMERQYAVPMWHRLRKSFWQLTAVAAYFTCMLSVIMPVDLLQVLVRNS